MYYIDQNGPGSHEDHVAYLEREFGDKDYHMHTVDEFYPLDEYDKHCVICTMGMLELAK